MKHGSSYIYGIGKVGGYSINKYKEKRVAPRIMRKLSHF